MVAKIGSLNVSMELETARFNDQIGRAQSSIRAAQAVIDRLSKQFNIATSQMTRDAGRVAASSKQMQAGMQQLSFQLGDVATMWSMGARPMQIFASQSGQVVQALQLMSSGGSKFGAFMSGPWGVALTAGAVVAGTLAGKLFDTEKAMIDVKFAASAVSDAQGILGGVLDMTTGKVNTQSKALIALAEAQLLVARVQAQARAAEARRGVADIQSRPVRLVGGPMGFTLNRRSEDARDAISQDVLAGRMDGRTAVERLENLRKVGRLTDEEFAKAASAVANLGVELENLKVYDSAGKLLSGTGGRELLTSKKDRSGGGRKGPSAETLADRATRRDKAFEDQLAGLNSELLSATRANVIDAGMQAQIARQQLVVEMDKLEVDIAAKVKLGDLNNARAEQLRAVAEQIKVQRLLTIDTEAAQAKAADMAKIASAANDNQRELLQVQEALAGTVDARRTIQLRVLEIDKREERARLEGIIASEKAAAIDKQIAEGKLKKLDELYAGRGEMIRQQNRLPLDEYLSRTDPAKNGERAEQLIVDELEHVHQGISAAIADKIGMGDDPLITGLLDILLEDILIRPLAEALRSARDSGSGGGSGLFGDLLGGLFGGLKIPGFASGTNYAPRGLAMVGERGPELVNLRGGERIWPNGEGPAGGGSGNIYHISGNLLTPEFWAQIQRMDAASAQQGSKMAIRDLSYRQSRSLR